MTVDETTDKTTLELARAGITVRRTMTTPNRAGKQPRPVWEVRGPAKYEGALFDAGARRWRGLFSFFEDPTAALLRIVRHDESQTYGERVEAKNERSLERAEQLEGFADKNDERSRARYEASSAIADGIPLGQPILVGHHSERRHRRDLERIHGHMRASVEHANTAKDQRLRADGAQRRVDAQESKAFMMRRIQEAEAILRKMERDDASSKFRTPEELHAYWRVHRPDSTLAEATAAFAERAARLQEQHEKIAYWRALLEETGGVSFTRDMVEVGAVVAGLHLHGGAVVLKKNPKTVTVAFLNPALTYADGSPSTSNVPYENIEKHAQPEPGSELRARADERADAARKHAAQSGRRL
jgi:hypothetical protein